MGASLGRGDGGLEGDMGLEPDGPPSPRPSTQPPQNHTDQKSPVKMTRGMGGRQLRLDSAGFPAAAESLRQCVNIDRIGWRSFRRPERRDFADQPVAQKLLQCQ